MPLDNATLPMPFRNENFRKIKSGIYDDSAVDVYVNDLGDFAVLDPAPYVDYSEYQPRRKKLSLDAYRDQELVAYRRFEKVRTRIPAECSFLEIGASEGAFLGHLRAEYPKMELSSVEPDLLTKGRRLQIAGLSDYVSIEEVAKTGRKFDCIGFFHVLEHIVDPSSFFDSVRELLNPGGVVAIEVPSYSDPLIRLYSGERENPYREFFYQRQHPYYYSAASLSRLLEYNKFSVSELVMHQRYGLENHLGWLVNGQPGGSKVFQGVFQGVEGAYMTALENAGHADAVIAFAVRR